MRALRERSPIWHALAWIGIYVAAVQIGDVFSVDVFDVENVVTGPLLVVLSVVMITYLRANGWLEHYGIRNLRRSDFTRSFFYLPLVLMALLQIVKGWDGDVDGAEVLLIVVLMVAVGFLEELVFRGLLYRALLTRRSVMAAVLISGVTFGVGHVVNLARGYSATEQILQVLVGIALGIVLALLFAVTGTILPGAVFHVVLNIVANLTAEDADLERYVVMVTIVVCLGYALYLVRRLRELAVQRGSLVG